MATAATEWHPVDRKRKRTLDKLEYELGLRKTLPPLSHYPITNDQRAEADDRASNIIFAMGERMKKGITRRIIDAISGA